MTSNNVFSINSGDPVSPEPDAEEQWMSDFIENHLGDFLAAHGELVAAHDPDEFRRALAEVKRAVKDWP